MKLLLFILFLPVSIYAQESSLIGITFKEYNYRIYPYIKGDSIAYTKIIDSITLQIQLYDKKGAAFVTVLDRKTKEKKEEGFYLNSLGLLSDYKTTYMFLSEPLERDTTFIIVDTYYQPLRHGSWKFYKFGKLFEEVIYDRGIIRKRFKY
jgi:hypothetical protein